MRSLSLGEEHGEEIHITPTTPGASADARRAGDAILMSRLDCDIRFVDLPMVPDRDLEGLLRFKLRSIYPGNPEDTVFDHRLVGEGPHRKAMLIVARRATLDRYRSAVGGARLYLPFSLLENYARERGAFRAWFCTEGWRELIVYQGGVLVSSTVYKREGEVAPDLRGADEQLAGEVREIPCVCVNAQAEDGAVPAGATGLEIRDLLESGRRPGGVFPPERRRSRVIPRGIRVVLLCAAALVLGVAVFYKEIGLTERHADASRVVYAELEIESRRVMALQREVEQLETTVSELEKRRPQNLYAALAALNDVLGEEARVTSLVIRDSRFQVEAVGRNSLRLMERFSAHEGFSDVELSQVVPDQAAQRERFSFSGSFRADR